ncbi:DUF4625 domain-containing protein [Carboxylicivirga marina]|uniref:DUF4625 domain-containing protein n=1 Tax=Carboxylicivirga marina TaxID=2800988 RepID=A0ABS1HFQ2_9BACT|nr:DUF4625 domain-containing protein [Carboxylicivirga marina]MBK3516483.1 DUF4625 domain-containing protein [Carboxylicivirga marina]
MYKIISKLSVLMLLAIVIVACGKEERDSEAPTMEIMKPLEGDTFTFGQPVLFTGQFFDNETLKDCEIVLTYNGAEKSAVLKGLESPWEAVNRGDAILFTAEELTSAMREDLQLFGEAVPICLSGSYTITFITSDLAGNKTEESVDINIALD